MRASAGGSLNRRQRRQAARQAKEPRGRRGGTRDTAVGADAADAELAATLNSVHRLHLAGDLEAAAKLYQRVLARQPNNHNAALFFGLLAHQAGDDEAAVRVIEHALRLAPRNPLALYNLGSALKNLGRTDEGLVACRQAIEIDPSCIGAHVALGTILQVMGRHDEANAAYETALTMNPCCPDALKNLAHGRKVRSEDPLTDRIRSALASDGLADAERSTLHFAMGKCLNDMADYDAAFSHYEAANRLSGKGRGFDPVAVEAEFEALIETFTPEFFAQRRDFGSASERPVFVVGMPRSGTTLVEQVIASHPQAFGAGELMTLNRVASALPSRLGTPTPYPGCAAHLDAAASDSLAATYLKDLDDRDTTALRVVDKMPVNFRHLGLIALIFPKARIIHCRREPVDVCLSCYFLDFVGRLPFAYDFSHLGLYYRHYERLMAHWRAVLPMPILDVHYEELVAAPEVETRRLVEHCGLEWDAACLNFHRNDRVVLTASHWQARQPIYKSSVARWRLYEKHLGPMIEALEGSTGSAARPAPANGAGPAWSSSRSSSGAASGA